MKREEALELLEHQHTFPGPFDFRIVVRMGTQAGVVSAISSVIGPDASVQDLTSRPSSKGTYEALVIRVQIGSAQQVLEVYELIQTLPDVVTAM